MEGYGYTYPPHFPQTGYPDGEFPDHGDGFGEYYGLGPLNGDREVNRRSRSKQRKFRKRDTKSSRSRSRTVSKSRSRSRSRTRTKSRSRSRSRTRTRSRSRTRSLSGSKKKLNLKEPSILDAFRVLYLTPSKHKKSTTKYLATKKRQDRIHELLKSDGLGSKRWLFYPRAQNRIPIDEVPGARDNCDQRVKIDGDFFRKYKRSKKVDADAPIAKLKRWELVFYKKLGFIQAV
ncbi:serine/arginine-rich splicing factor 4-like [Maniola hyperantus]|uniref:serine/arginine-rich splicing factor 4-like n=1 Tax=Aphantopus hyperantus TaxID=2795564 RepID=UPI001567CD52|nr:serine/arginine-rich splicing factor 4-like isoform X2 [Maniola hyperantus]